MWRAERGDVSAWRVTALDFAATALAYARSTAEAMSRMASGVAPGGTLLLVGHQPIDPATGAATAAAGQLQVSVDAALAAPAHGLRSDQVSAYAS